MTKSTVTEHLSGLMAESILDNGAKESNMAAESTSKKEKRGKESGKWVRESSGLKTEPS